MPAGIGDLVVGAGRPALEAGDDVLPDTEVALVVSSGPAPRTVPNLVNMPFADARAALAELRLKVERVEPRFSHEIPKGSVMAAATGSRTQGGAGLDRHRPRVEGTRPAPGAAARRVHPVPRPSSGSGTPGCGSAGCSARPGASSSTPPWTVSPSRAGDRLRRGTPVDLVLF